MTDDPLTFDILNERCHAENQKQEMNLQLLFCQIGKVCSAFAHLEWQLNRCFASAVNRHNDAIGLCIADNLSYRSTCSAFAAVCRIITETMRPEVQEALAALDKKLDQAPTLRNDAAHSWFDVLTGSVNGFVQVPARVKRRGQRREKLISDPGPMLEKFLEDIYKTEQELIEFTKHYIV